MRNRMFLLVPMCLMLGLVPWVAAQQVRRLWASSRGYGDMRGTPLKSSDWFPVTPLNQESPFEIGWFSRAFGADLWSGIVLTAGGK